MNMNELQSIGLDPWAVRIATLRRDIDEDVKTGDDWAAGHCRRLALLVALRLQARRAGRQGTVAR